MSPLTAPGTCPQPRPRSSGGGTNSIRSLRLCAAARWLPSLAQAGSVRARLAIEVARSLLSGYPDGAWLVEPAPVADGSAVAAAVGTALGVEPGPGPAATADMLQRVGEFLSRLQALLVLDNCEHVAGGAARVVDHLLALGRRADLRILATSREQLERRRGIAVAAVAAGSRRRR